MKGGMPQMYGGIFGRWLIGKLEYANKDYVSGSNGHDNLAIRGKMSPKPSATTTSDCSSSSGSTTAYRTPNTASWLLGSR